MLFHKDERIFLVNQYKIPSLTILHVEDIGMNTNKSVKALTLMDGDSHNAMWKKGLSASTRSTYV